MRYKLIFKCPISFRDYVDVQVLEGEYLGIEQLEPDENAIYVNTDISHLYRLDDGFVLSVNPKDLMRCYEI